MPLIKKTIRNAIDKGWLVWVSLVLLMFLARIVVPSFLEVKNLSNIVKMASFVGIAAIGQTLVIISGGIDMSISNVITFACIVSAQIMSGNDAKIVPAFFSAIILGAFCGAINASGVFFFKIPPMIMTLGLGTIIEGISMIYCNGAPKGTAAPLLRHIVNDVAIFGTTTWLTVLWIATTIVICIIMRKTVPGRRLYALGTNPTSAHFSGINRCSIIYSVYIISGIAAAITGVLLAGYTKTAAAKIGAPYSMESIVAVVIGGTAITGGKGSYAGTFAGAIILIVLESMLTVINIPESGREIAQGIIIILMVIIYAREKQKY